MTAHDPNGLLSKPVTSPTDVVNRVPSIYRPLRTFDLPRGQAKHYQQQYADMYFTRLAQLKPALVTLAHDAFADFEVAGETAKAVDRVLDVRQGELCWVIGTVYIDMPLKPNVLEDIGKEHWIAAPPPRKTYSSADGSRQVMLEDESGRLHITGSMLQSMVLVTGVIIAVLGTENSDGEFEVLDLRTPDLPRQPKRWEGDDAAAALNGKKIGNQKRGKSGKVAIVSGLAFSGDEGDTLALDLLQEWLLGEATGSDTQSEAAQISRLIIAGNSFAHASPIPSREDVALAKKNNVKKYGYDAAAYNSAPSDRFDAFLATLLPSIPITLLPGVTDPTSTTMPQQMIHPALFSHSRAYMELSEDPSLPPGWFDSTTNPSEFDVDGWRFIVAGGQTLDDVYKYVPTLSESADGVGRLELMEAMLRWRLTAPTAPDTLPCYPFQEGDKFVVRECPHYYVVGCQEKLEVGHIEGPQGQRVCLVTVPKYKDTGQVVVLDMESGAAEIMTIGLLDSDEV